MKRTIDRMIFRIRWLVMSEKSRYAYLLARTKEHLGNGYLTREQWLQKSFKPE
jgi:hypothetical protein